MQVLNLAINRNNINNGESNLKVFFLNQLNIIYQIPVYIYIYICKFFSDILNFFLPVKKIVFALK